jgi:alpha-1,2-mannosyltransferase
METSSKAVLDRKDPDHRTLVRTPMRPLLLVAVGAAVLAVGVRAVILAHSGGLSGLLGYDQGVYYSAAEAFAWGRLPYRDFLFLHPPGVVVALAPLGLVGRLTHDSLGIELARAVTVLVGAVNTALVALAARRAGLVAAGAAAAFYAVWRPVAVTETETRLEPFLSLGLLVALAVLATGPERVRRRTLVVAGCGLGFALTVKIWAVVPVVVVLIWFFTRFGRRVVAWVVGPLLAVAVAVCLPFLVAAPSSMFRMVVLDQLSRGRMASTAMERVGGVLGLSSYVAHHPSLDGPLVLVLVGGVAAILLVWVRVPSARVAVVLLVAQGSVLVASPSYFSYYDAYPAPALALCVGAAVAAALGVLGAARLPSRSWVAGVRRAASTALVLGLLAGLGTVVRSDTVTVVGRAFPAATIRGGLAHARCVTADSVSALVQLNVFGRDLRRGCPLVIDVGGLSHDRDAAKLANGLQTPKREDLRWQRDVSAYLESGTVQVLVRRHHDGFDRATLRRLHRSGLLVNAGSYQVYGPARADARGRNGASIAQTASPGPGQQRRRHT